MDSDSDEEDNGDGLQSKNLRGDNETDEARLKRLFEKIKSIESRMASRNGGQSISKKVKREERPVMQFMDFEIQILVDGTVLPEYDVQYDEEGKIATCWIPSDAGKSFTATEKLLKQFEYDIAKFMYADGTFIAGTLARAGRIPPIKTIDSKRVSPTTARPLLFSDIELTDDDVYLNAGVKDLGNLKWTILRGETSTVAREYENDAANDTSEKKVHERSKKGMKHQVSFGDQVDIPNKNIYDFKSHSTICEFIFKYRSPSILRADGIAPPASPPPPPTNTGKRKASEPIDNDVDHRSSQQPASPRAASTELDEDEIQLKYLREQITSLESRLAAKSGGKKSSKKVKREHQPTFLPGEVIDLT
ncbi:hypothetical protein H0H93_004188 [Arthromyces matolae]|nr:hypothetical protein H0H93_004188 [Arthromyces matolae]